MVSVKFYLNHKNSKDYYMLPTYLHLFKFFNKYINDLNHYFFDQSNEYLG